VRTRPIEPRPPKTGVELRFAPLGIPTRIIADDSALLDAAIANFADLNVCAADGDATLTIRLRWNALATSHVGFAVSAKGSCLTIEGDGILGRANASLKKAECSLPRAYGADGPAVAEIGETLLLFLLTRAGRPPVHAAAVMIGETAVLLAGPSGSGKSSLALAAQLQGLEVLSEDTTYIQLDPRLRIWGWPGSIHLDSADAPPGAFPQRERGGLIKSAIPRKCARISANRAILLAIERGHRLGLEQAGAAELVALLAPIEPGFALLRSRIEHALGTLAQAGGWRMTLNKSAGEAVALLRRQFGSEGL